MISCVFVSVLINVNTVRSSEGSRGASAAGAPPSASLSFFLSMSRKGIMYSDRGYGGCYRAVVLGEKL